MYQKILLPIADDDGAPTDEVLTVARSLLAPAGRITILHVRDEIPAHVASYIPEEVLERTKAEMVQMLRGVADRCGSDCVVEIRSGHPGRRILDEAETLEPDCIVMRSHRPVIEDVIFGSTAAHVVRHATCSVHVVR